jgi:hypothetical protein
MLFFLFWNYLGTPNGPQNVLKGPQVGGTYGPMFKLKNKPPNQIIRPILLGEMVRDDQKTGFYAVFLILGPFGHPQMDPKRYSKVRK